MFRKYLSFPAVYLRTFYELCPIMIVDGTLTFPEQEVPHVEQDKSHNPHIAGNIVCFSYRNGFACDVMIPNGVSTEPENPFPKLEYPEKE